MSKKTRILIVDDDSSRKFYKKTLKARLIFECHGRKPAGNYSSIKNACRRKN